MERTISPATDADWKRRFRKQLLAWFRAHARDLPWRRTRDPYHVWVSEIMLQQTQVVTVIPYFQRFIAAFPTVAQLAAAPEQQVLQLWEGLGYYRRARQLHRAAQIIVNEFEGRLPDDLAAWRSLPGIGRYTAGAVLSISQDQRLPILEANTVRLFARLLAYRDDPTTRAGQETLWSFAEEILPLSEPGAFNQALMELGALVCTPRTPDCPQCPVMTLCPTFALGQQASIPAAKQPKNYTFLREACVAIWRDETLLVRRCQDGERWAGLWDFPRFPLQDGAPLQTQLQSGVRKLCGLRIRPGSQVGTIKHGVTRYRITLECFQADWKSGEPSEPAAARWMTPSELRDLPLTTPARRFSKLLESLPPSPRG